MLPGGPIDCFWLMGNASSESTFGYRVVAVQHASPASSAGLIPFFDFILAANDVTLDKFDAQLLPGIITNSLDQELYLKVLNVKSGTERDVVIVPTRKWGDSGNQESALGMTIRHESYFEADEHVIHVVEVEADSPAALAGLIADKDYLLGTGETVFTDTDVLYDALNANIDKPVEFYVYNSESDEVRITVIMPNNQWGGEGILGASCAHGLLHKLPAECCRTNGIIHESLFTSSLNNSTVIEDNTTLYEKINATIQDGYNGSNPIDDQLSYETIKSTLM